MGNVVHNYAIPLCGNMITGLSVVIVLKCIEIWNHCVVYQELTQCCRSLYFKNKQTHRNRDWVCGYQRWGMWGKGNWMKVVKMYKLAVIR